jgi:hypothetical protein
LESRVGIGTAATLCFPPAPARATHAQAAGRLVIAGAAP